ncbi:MAG: SxtJ family membrane protein [Planctomycetota bacterium]|jgi:hypothetical protein
MIDIKKDLGRTETLVMGLLLGLFFGLIGGLVYWRAEAFAAACILWSVGGALMLLYYAVPSLRRPLYLGWMYAVFPIGWTVSHIILGVLFYLLITPVGSVMRLFGRDTMCRRIDAEAGTYWVERKVVPKAASYFRQF